mmetsp:Transcript_2762/g.3927  ORF Transcript_2762/g.3927 Transcript_2762/m.3927 type:complete len:348 (-) Transcript_2762:152-1195(-)
MALLVSNLAIFLIAISWTARALQHLGEWQRKYPRISSRGRPPATELSKCRRNMYIAIIFSGTFSSLVPFLQYWSGGSYRNIYLVHLALVFFPEMIGWNYFAILFIQSVPKYCYAENFHGFRDRILEKRSVISMHLQQLFIGCCFGFASLSFSVILAIKIFMGFLVLFNSGIPFFMWALKKIIFLTSKEHCEIIYGDRIPNEVVATNMRAKAAFLVSGILFPFIMSYGSAFFVSDVLQSITTLQYFLCFQIWASIWNHFGLTLFPTRSVSKLPTSSRRKIHVGARDVFQSYEQKEQYYDDGNQIRQVIQSPVSSVAPGRGQEELPNTRIFGTNNKSEKNRNPDLLSEF